MIFLLLVLTLFIDAECLPYNDSTKYATLLKYAPRVWNAKGEKYLPSSVEWSFKYMTRFQGPDGKYWVQTTEPLKQPESILPYFAGEPGAPMYGYWALKKINNATTEVVDLIYFFYWPYNLGKYALGDIYGNHVGDWEHLSIRLSADLKPLQVYYSYHAWGDLYNWDQVEKVNGTHPIAYTAYGSHGIWKDPGLHKYGAYIKGVIEMADECSNGTRWDGWAPGNLRAFDWDNKNGLGGTDWPWWMNQDFTTPGSNPTDGGVFRYGNQERACSKVKVGGTTYDFCELEDGPTGPVSKGVWGTKLE